MSRAPYKMGRLAAKRPVGLRDLSFYLQSPLPTPPAQIAPPEDDAWGMLGNDTYGDCTIAGVAHLEMANAIQNHEPVPYFTTNMVVNTYLTLTHGADSGLQEADVLHTWHTAGLFNRKNGGYAPVNHRNVVELKQVTAAFGGVYLGVLVPDSAQQQFAAGQPWSVVPDAQIEGGHAVPLVGYDASFAYVITWGKVQPVTYGWLAAYLEEAWAVITPEDASVNLAQLQKDLKQVK